jgi:predicted RNA methylase
MWQIMGLNPPFGVKASRANQFIDHALKFKPKLLVLIVPKETERSVPRLKCFILCIVTSNLSPFLHVSRHYVLGVFHLSVQLLKEHF